ncbi:MAG: phage tail protein [Afipia sp.]
MIRRLIIATAWFFLLDGHAKAEPITIALFGAAFASTLAGSVVTFLFTAAILTGASLLVDAIKPKPKATTDTSTPPGIQFEVQMGEDSPIGFTVGTTATAGTRKYIGTWGHNGSTPNAYLTDVIQIGDLPAPGAPGLWVNGQKCTLTATDPTAGPAASDLFTAAVDAASAVGLTIFSGGFASFLANYIATHGGDAGQTSGGLSDLGYPVLEFRKNGRDYLWVKYRDGTQTEADPLLMAKFAGHAERPFKATMIGRGCPYLIITALFNRDLFSGGNMTYLAEPPETPWYDIRLDDSAGGDGDHRWDDPSTWEPTSNPAVIVYNIIRGVTYNGEWLYGGQNLSAFRLPADNFMAAANECDADRELEDDEFEPQFRCGMEVRGDMEPLTVIAELLKACSGRIAEVGGIFKFLVGAPPAAVYAFTDDDILVTRGQSLTPFPTIDDTHNGIEATYPEPEEMWATKDAPARYSAAFEAADQNRRLATGIHFAAVPFPVQVQQHMQTMIEEDRRFRIHSHHLPPDAYPLEPLDVVSWTSVKNGYLNKKFLINRIVGERTTNQMVLLKEINPGDYGWSSSNQLPSAVGHISIVRPPAQPMTGWQAAPAIIKDTDGINRRPSIQIQFDGNQDDVRAVRAQVRLAGEPALIFDGELPYGAPAVGVRFVTLNAVLLPNTAYEARGIFVPYSGRETTWSAWLAVTTPDVKLSTLDFEAGLKDYVTQHLPAQIKAVDFKAQRIAQIVADQDAGNELTNRATRVLLDQQGVTISETAQIALGINGKLTGAVFNTIDNNGFVTGTFHYNDGTTAAFTIVATDFYLAAPGVNGGQPVPVFTIGTSGGEANVVLRGNFIGDGYIKAHHIQVDSIRAISGDFGDATFTGTATGGPDGLLDLNFTGGVIIGYRIVP